MRAEDVDIAGLPEDYTAARPRAEDAAEVTALLAEHERRGKGSSSASEDGVLTTLTDEQAEVRARPGEGNKGREAALAAVEMATLMRALDGGPAV